MKLTALFIIYNAISFGQEIKIGEMYPDVLIKNVFNYPSDSLRFSDFKKKLVIIDFWGTGCISCIKAFPKIDSLQKKFANDIQFILVNKESPDSTKRFFAKRNKIKTPDVPIVMGDSVLHNFFPHIYVPHHVWIDKNGVVLAITNDRNTSSENIKDFLAKERIQLSEKRDTLMKSSESFFWLAEIADKQGKLDYCSYFTKGVIGIRSSGGFRNTFSDDPKEQRDIDINMAYADNLSILSMLEMAFAEGAKYNFEHSNSVFLNVKDPLKYRQPSDMSKFDEWLKTNPLYCYRLVVSEPDKTSLFGLMQEDMERYFNINVKIEKRTIKCLVLKRTSKNDKLRSKGGTSQNRLWVDDSTRYLKNREFGEFVLWLKTSFDGDRSPVPFIDLTNYKGKVDIKINNAFIPTLVMAQLRKELRKYDLDLVEENCLSDVLIISEK